MIENKIGLCYDENCHLKEKTKEKENFSMKKLLAMVLAVTVVLSLAACGKKDKEPETTAATTAATTVPTTEPTTEPTTIPTTEATTVPTTEATTVPTEPELQLPEGFTMVDENVYATRNVNIRTEPNVSSHSPGQLMRGEAVLRIGVSGDGWSAVLYKDEVRYIASKYLTTQQSQTGGNGGTPVKVTESASSGTVYANHYVNIRKGPGADTAKLGQVPEGAAVTRLAVCSNGWVKISYSGIVGYVAGGYLSDKAPEKPTEKPTENPVAPTVKPVDPSAPAGGGSKDPSAPPAGGGSQDPSGPAGGNKHPSVPKETQEETKAETEAPVETKDETKAPEQTQAPDPSAPAK